MTLRELLSLPNVSLDSKICAFLDEYGAFYNVTCDTEVTDSDMICLLLAESEG